MKTIQITIEKNLLSAVDRALKGRTRRRSAFIRHSIASELQRLDGKRLEELDREGYRKRPLEPGEFERGAELSWGESWERKVRKPGRR